MPKKFPFYKQHDETDCGATCLRMIARYHGRYYSLEYLRELTFVDRQGVSLTGISDAAEAIGYHTLGLKIDYDRLVEDLPLPCIAFWRQSHFVVVYKANKKHVWIGDPASGVYKITRQEFLDGWVSDTVDGQGVGVLLLLETTPEFYAKDDQKTDRASLSYLFSYFKKHKRLLFQLCLGLFFGSILQLVFPLVMKAVVDTGISLSNSNFIVIMFIAYGVLFFSQTIVESVRSWILLHLGVRVNISLISDFLVKMMNQPIRFFDTRMTGDIMQRINDHQRVERLLNSASLTAIFSAFTLVIFGVVLFYFSFTILIIFLIGTLFYFMWVYYFLKKRKELDYKRFDQLAANQSSLMQLVTGIEDIKLHNAEKLKRWQWERIQAKLYRVSAEYLAVDQWQRSGAQFLNESKNILISFIAAKAVVDGSMTLGMLVAIQYIIGQLNSPVEQMIQFIHSLQDARISLERMNEIHQKEDEEGATEKISILPENGDLKLENVTFQYGGPHSPVVLREVNLEIPKGKTTAIVGTSGSGKTTLIKLLLNFYPPSEGIVKLGDINLENFHKKAWRDRCGAVLQDGFIFSESIARNIALGVEVIDKKQLLKAVKLANIQEYIESLPLGYNTKIGQEGIGLSQGQKQRLLIARAIYKDPEYFFFDEATNALDATNEREIMGKLDAFFEGKTVIIVAHRLSTVRAADHIVVIDKGQIIERGNHEQLVALGLNYYRLVKDQLELGT